LISEVQEAERLLGWKALRSARICTLSAKLTAHTLSEASLLSAQVNLNSNFGGNTKGHRPWSA